MLVSFVEFIKRLDGNVFQEMAKAADPDHPDYNEDDPEYDRVLPYRLAPEDIAYLDTFKQVPGFAELEPKDQINFIKNAIMKLFSPMVLQHQKDKTRIEVNPSIKRPNGKYENVIMPVDYDVPALIERLTKHDKRTGEPMFNTDKIDISAPSAFRLAQQFLERPLHKITGKPITLNIPFEAASSRTGAKRSADHDILVKFERKIRDALELGEKSGDKNYSRIATELGLPEEFAKLGDTRKGMQRAIQIIQRLDDDMNATQRMDPTAKVEAQPKIEGHEGVPLDEVDWEYLNGVDKELQDWARENGDLTILPSTKGLALIALRSPAFVEGRPYKHPQGWFKVTPGKKMGNGQQLFNIEFKTAVRTPEDDGGISKQIRTMIDVYVPVNVDHLKHRYQELLHNGVFDYHNLMHPTEATRLANKRSVTGMNVPGKKSRLTVSAPLEKAATAAKRAKDAGLPPEAIAQKIDPNQLKKEAHRAAMKAWKLAGGHVGERSMQGASGSISFDDVVQEIWIFLTLPDTVNSSWYDDNDVRLRRGIGAGQQFINNELGIKRTKTKRQLDLAKKAERRQAAVLGPDDEAAAKETEKEHLQGLRNFVINYHDPDEPDVPIIAKYGVSSDIDIDATTKRLWDGMKKYYTDNNEAPDPERMGEMLRTLLADYEDEEEEELEKVPAATPTAPGKPSGGTLSDDEKAGKKIQNATASAIAKPKPPTPASRPPQSDTSKWDKMRQELEKEKQEKEARRKKKPDDETSSGPSLF